MVNFLKGFTKHLTIRAEALLPPGLSYQFFSEVFPKRVQVNVFYISMFYMQMPLFGSTLGLTGTDPVGGFVAGAFETIFFNERFQ